MKTTKKSLALLLALAMLATMMVSVFTGCQTNPGTGEETGTSAEENTDSGNQPGGEETSGPSDSKVNYTVQVTSEGGLILAGANVYIYTDETLEDMDGYTETDETGTAMFSLKPGNDYHIVLSGIPDGYEVAESYTFDANRTASIVLSSKVIEDTDISGVSYGLGSVMHNFTVVDSDGTSHTLTDILAEKKAAVLNFWFVNCTYCVEEFPALNAVYADYSDKLEVLALNDTSDTEDEIKLFKADMGLSFPMVKDYSGMGPAFGVEGYPTTVVIDRYGVVCLVASGAMTEKQFRAVFNHVTSDDYEQILFASPEDLVPVQKPDKEMPSSEELSAVLNKGDITVTYTPELDEEAAEYSWPFIIGDKDGTACIYPSNQKQDSSYATLYANVTLKKGEALALDYYASSEQGCDILFILVDRKDIFQISGESSQWNTCYPFVALEDGEYEVAFCYYKDDGTDMGDDTVYMKDLRVVKESDIDVATYIPRYAANHLREDGFGYEDYVEVVYNEEDNYYHVGTKDGPILLVDLMKATRFSGESVYSLAYTGKVELDGKNYYEDMLPYFNMASNATINGFCSVTPELRRYLEITAAAVGIESGNENQWLQMCSYYDAYGTGGVQLDDPIKGLSADSAYTATLGDDNYVYYSRVIMPRGLWYEFIPEKSGAYRITSHSEFEVDGWVFLADGTQYYVHGGGERYLEVNDEDYFANVSMVVYMEAGTPYYIDIAFYDVYQVGGFNFSVEYLGETYDQFMVASPGYFTFPDNGGATDITEPGEILSGGIDIVLGDDGYYHELRADGTVGSILYADFIYSSTIFSHSIEELIASGAFDFSMTENDQQIKAYMAQYGEKTEEKLKEIWGESFEAMAEEYKLYECLEGITHGDGPDLTEDIKKFLSQKIAYSEEAPELEGCVPVDEELAELLQQLMDKFTFSGVEYSWAKLCYYYRAVDKAGA